MGVQGLWDLASPAGQRVNFTALENKVVAVDASIWMYHFLKAMRDEKGDMLKGAHMIGFFRRICKLLYLKIRPVFVFDGPPPTLKWQTLRLRAQQRASEERVRRKAVERLLRNQLQQHILRAAAASGAAAGASNVEGEREADERRADEPAVAPEREQDLQQDAEDEGSQSEESVASAHPPPEVPAAGSRRWERRRTRNGTVPLPFRGFMAKRRGVSEVVVPELPDEPLRDILQVPDRRNARGRMRQPDEWKGYALPGGGIVTVPLDGPVALEEFEQLDPKTRYMLLQQAQEAWFGESRVKSVEAKDDMGAFVNVQLEMFLRHIRTNKELEKVKRSMAEQTSRPAGGDLAEGEVYRPPSFLQRAQAEQVPVPEEAQAPEEPAEGKGKGKGRGKGRGRKQRQLDGAEPKRLEPLLGSGDAEEAMSWLEAPSADEADVEQPAEVARDPMEEDPENAEDLFGSAYFDEAAEPSSPVVEDQELAPELRPSKRLRCEPPELEVDVLEEEEVEMAWSRSLPSSDAAGRLACTPPQSLSAPSHVEEVLQMEEDEDAGEQDAEDKEEEEDPKEDPRGWDQQEQEQRIFKSSSISPSPGPEGNAVANEALLQEGSGSASSGLGRADGVPAPLSPSSTKVDFVQDVPECESPGPTKAKEVAQQSAETEPFSSILPRPARGGQASSSQATLQVEEVRIGSQAASASSTSGPRAPSEPNDAAAVPTASSSARASPLLVDRAEAAAKTAAAAAASKMAPKPGSISATADSAIDGVWCTTHFQYRWRCRQDGVCDACEAGQASAAQPQTAGSTGSGKGKAKGKGKSSRGGAEEATLGDDELEELEFQRLAAELEDEHRELRAEARRAKRGADVVTPEMQADVEALLEALGIPYVHAPAEAEAQCAFLAEARLVDAVASDDSDVLVFGAREVYRRLFSEDHLVECYSAARLESRLGLLQGHLVVLAMLLGCDYTLGVHGVGIVNGLEIVRAFSPERDGMSSLEVWLQRLKDFRSWSQNVANWGEESAGIVDADGKAVAEFKRKHTNFRTQWSFPDDFPSAAVIDAFHRPEVDRSLEPFAWAPVDLRRAVVQLQKSCDLTEEKILERLEPAVRRYEDTLRQPRITEYMIPSDAGDVAVVRSSRMQRALRGLRGESPEPEDEAGQAADAEAEAGGLSRRRRRRNGDAEGSGAPRARGRGRGRRGRGRQASQVGAAAAFASLGGAECAEIDLDDSE